MILPTLLKKKIILPDLISSFRVYSMQELIGVHNPDTNLRGSWNKIFQFNINFTQSFTRKYETILKYKLAVDKYSLFPSTHSILC